MIPQSTIKKYGSHFELKSQWLARSVPCKEQINNKEIEMKILVTLILGLTMLSANAENKTIFSTDFTGGTIGEDLTAAYGDSSTWTYSNPSWTNHDGYIVGIAKDFQLVVTTNSVTLAAGDSISQTVKVKTSAMLAGKLVMDVGIGDSKRH